MIWPFHVGDVVEYELDAENPPGPRWNMHTDNGGCGKWVIAHIFSLSSATIETIDTQGLIWSWPSPDEYDYVKNERPGFLTLLTEREKPYNPLDRFIDLEIE